MQSSRKKRKKKNGRAVTLTAMEGLLEEYLQWLEVRQYSQYSIATKRVYLTIFYEWCSQRGIIHPGELTRPMVEQFQTWLFHYRKKNGQPLASSSQKSRLEAVKTWFSWLTRYNHILANPASDVILPRMGFHLPKNILTQKEVELILNQPDIDTPLGIRDRAILEVLYSTGMRRLEAVNLTIYSLDPELQTLLIHQGKGKKDRVIPIGDHALSWTRKYLYDIRPSLVVPPDQGELFLSVKGEPFTPGGLSHLVRTYIDAAEIRKKGSCHLFRHTMATLMLENGADIRYIQHMLGHSKLDTTQIYTHISIKALKRVHAMTHPASFKRPSTGVPSQEQNNSTL